MIFLFPDPKVAQPFLVRFAQRGGVDPVGIGYGLDCDRVVLKDMI